MCETAQSDILTSVDCGLCMKNNNNNNNSNENERNDIRWKKRKENKLNKKRKKEINEIKRDFEQLQKDITKQQQKQ